MIRHKPFFCFFILFLALQVVSADPIANTTASINVDVVPTCGDGICVSPESCFNCLSDCGCDSGYHCSSGKCVKDSSGGGGSSRSSSSDDYIPYVPEPVVEEEEYSHFMICARKCGDGVCQVDECLEPGCPCMEDEFSCEQDCYVAPVEEVVEEIVPEEVIPEIKRDWGQVVKHVMELILIFVGTGMIVAMIIVLTERIYNFLVNRKKKEVPAEVIMPELELEHPVGLECLFGYSKPMSRKERRALKKYIEADSKRVEKSFKKFFKN